jgi:hypothetical protein
MDLGFAAENNHQIADHGGPSFIVQIDDRFCASSLSAISTMLTRVHNLRVLQ